MTLSVIYAFEKHSFSFVSFIATQNEVIQETFEAKKTKYLFYLLESIY